MVWEASGNLQSWWKVPLHRVTGERMSAKQRGEAPCKTIRSHKNSLSQEQHGSNRPHDSVLSHRVLPMTYGDYGNYNLR